MTLKKSNNLLDKFPGVKNVLIITKSKNINEALCYASKTLESNWSRTVPAHQSESNFYSRQGNAITNLEATLDGPLSGLATEILKDPYKLDFLFNAKELVLSVTIFCFQGLTPSCFEIVIRLMFTQTKKILLLFFRDK